MTLSILQLRTQERNLIHTLSFFALISPLSSIHGVAYLDSLLLAKVTNIYSWLRCSSSNLSRIYHCNMPWISSKIFKNQTIQQNNEADSCFSRDSIRLCKLLASYGHNFQLSRRAAEHAIINGFVTVSGQKVVNPCQIINQNQEKTIKINGKLLVFNPLSTIKVWLVHKLKGEIVTEDDPLGRNSMMKRLKYNNFVSYKDTKYHLKPIGRLDYNTEGLMVITNDGSYANQMELPRNSIHRTYRVRVYGVLTDKKIKAIQKGMIIRGIKYKGMNVVLESNDKIRSKNRDFIKGSKKEKLLSNLRRKRSNHWLRITCVEGKNRQIRKILSALKLTISRLIRISFGDYNLNKIPQGMAIEVQVKPIDKQKKKGVLIPHKIESLNLGESCDEITPQGKHFLPIQWINYSKKNERTL